MWELISEGSLTADRQSVGLIGAPCRLYPVTKAVTLRSHYSSFL